MLNPINTAAVIRSHGMVGRFPGEIHPGVAWWIGACFVVTRQAHRIVVADNGHSGLGEFTDRFCRGATNAKHHACTVFVLGKQTERELLDTMRELGGAPGARLSADDHDDGLTVRINLYDEHGASLTEGTGLAEIRHLINEDRVPIPVNNRARGTIQPWSRAETAPGEPL